VIILHYLVIFLLSSSNSKPVLNILSCLEKDTIDNQKPAARVKKRCATGAATLYRGLNQQDLV